MAKISKIALVKDAGSGTTTATNSITKTITQTTLEASTGNISLPIFRPTIPPPTVIAPPTYYFTPVDNEIINSGEEDIPEVESTIVARVLDLYKDQLEDPESLESKFFTFLNTARTTEEDKIFNTVYMMLDQKYTDVKMINDFLSDSELTFVNLEIILSHIDTFKLDRVRKQLYNYTYQDQGKLFDYLVTSDLTTEDNEFLLKSLDKDMQTPPDFFLLKAKVDLLKEDHFRSFREAEERYWEVIEDYPEEYSFILTQDYSEETHKYYDTMLTALFNKHESQAVFLSQPALKSVFHTDKTINSEIGKLLKGEYKHLTITDIYSYIDKLAFALVKGNYANSFDTLDPESIPDLERFTTTRIDELLTKPEVSVDALKEMKFMNEYLSGFFRLNSVSFKTLLENIEDDLDTLRGIYIDLRNDLLNTGMFTERGK